MWRYFAFMHPQCSLCKSPEVITTKTSDDIHKVRLFACELFRSLDVIREVLAGTQRLDRQRRIARFDEAFDVADVLLALLAAVRSRFDDFATVVDAFLFLRQRRIEERDVFEHIIAALFQ